MSELPEKLEPQVHTEGKNAVATLKQLQQRWGAIELIHIKGMGKLEVWRHIHGKGLDATYERQEEE